MFAAPVIPPAAVHLQGKSAGKRKVSPAAGVDDGEANAASPREEPDKRSDQVQTQTRMQHRRPCSSVPAMHAESTRLEPKGMQLV